MSHLLLRAAHQDVADLDVGGGLENGEDRPGHVRCIEHAHGGAGLGERLLAAAEILVKERRIHEAGGDAGHLDRRFRGFQLHAKRLSELPVGVRLQPRPALAGKAESSEEEAESRKDAEANQNASGVSW